MNFADLHVPGLARLEEPVSLLVHLVPHLLDLASELPVVVVEEVRLVAGLLEVRLELGNLVLRLPLVLLVLEAVFLQLSQL